MNLSLHFTLDELIRSQEASRFGIDNYPSPEIIENLRALCADILEPLRNAISRPITVSSGYRCKLLNHRVGGAKNSDHVRGLAADITAAGLSTAALGAAVRSLSPYVPLSQCINEFPPHGWIHVSRVALGEPYDADHSPSFLIASLERGETVYSRWDA